MTAVSPAIDRSVVDAARLRRRLTEVVGGADADEVRIVRAPGRVNLIGEHTDYNGGFVLPLSIDLETHIAFVPTEDGGVVLALDATGEQAGFDLDAIPARRGDWLDYVAGTAGTLAEAGIATRGFRGLLASSIPMSTGLSSSAALELATAWALLDPPDPRAHGIDRMGLAQLAQRAENEHVGVNCGLMDQFAVSLGRRSAAMLLDCRSLEYRPVPLPLGEHVLVVCDSGSPRRLGTSDYNARRAQCERAVATIAEHDRDVRSLRDVDAARLAAAASVLDAETLRRCEHVVHENERVLACVAALEAGDLETVGRLLAESHASLRDLYEVSSPELDALVEIATGVEGVVGARMTGAGFGGCTVNLVARDAVGALEAAVEREYERRTGLRARVIPVAPADGAGPVSVGPAPAHG